ncbi:MAG: response regulator [Flavobacterium sp.]|nr:MAG: response regulator [Flavobacterium sp.]
MSEDGPIVIVEDDEDDVEIFTSIVKDLKLKNEILRFANTDDALRYLHSSDQVVYLIFCDINLPGKNGIEFKREIDANPELRNKSIPFLFYSTVARQSDVNEAYTQLTVQGFFQKQNSYSEMKSTLQRIFDYWEICKHPNKL